VIGSMMRPEPVRRTPILPDLPKCLVSGKKIRKRRAPFGQGSQDPIRWDVMSVLIDARQDSKLAGLA
jgi:hypothetical protein